MALDITVLVVLRVLLAFVLLRAVWHKLRDMPRFTLQLDDYELLPQPLLRPVAFALMFAEGTLGLALLVPSWPWPAALTAGLLLLYALAMAINLLRGREDLDCGCEGPASTAQGISWALVLRNTVLAAIGVLSASVAVPRGLTIVDVGTVALASAAVILVYASIEQAIANRQRERHFIETRGGAHPGAKP